MPSQQGIFPKRSLDGNPKIDHFSPHHQTTPSKSFHRGLTFPVLVRYKWVVLQPLCVHSTILCICLLLLPSYFCVGSWACTVSSYFPMGLDIGLAEVPTHLVPWAFVLVTSLLAMPIDLLAVIDPLGFSPFFWVSATHLLSFYLLLCIWACWLSFLSCWPIGLFISFLGHDPFTLLLPLVVPMSLLALIPTMLAHWALYLFSWVSTTHLLYFYLLLCIRAC